MAARFGAERVCRAEGCAALVIGLATSAARRSQRDAQPHAIDSCRPVPACRRSDGREASACVGLTARIAGGQRPSRGAPITDPARKRVIPNRRFPLDPIALDPPLARRYESAAICAAALTGRIRISASRVNAPCR